MRIITLLSATLLIALSLSCRQVYGNDAPVNLQGGGAQALAGATYAITMESEVVKIVLGKTSYIVDATFNFSNSGKTAIVDVGFPKRGLGWLGDDFHEASDFIRFETWVGSEPVGVREAPGFASIEGRYTLPGLVKYIKERKFEDLRNLMVKDYRWLVKEKVKFEGGKRTTTRVRYEAKYHNFGAECKGGLTYIYGTGSMWMGNKGYIGESKFIVDVTGIQKDDQPKNMGFGEDADKSKATCNTIGDGIFQCVMSNYKPSTEDASVVVGIGCEGE